MSDHTVAFYTAADGTPHIRVDAPGVAAVSAPVGDPMQFIVTAASQLDLEVDDSQNADGLGPITISVPPGD
jgi:hypothetical protein